MMLKMNKKGQTNVLGNLFSIIPKPLLFIIFIMFLGLFASLLSPVFNSFGLYCDSGHEVVKLTDSSFISNLVLVSSLPDADEISGDSLDPNSKFNSCTKFINGSDRLISSRCIDCDLLSDDVIPFRYSQLDFCEGDAFVKSDLSWFNRKTCPVDNCVIPDGYYFEFDSGLFECVSDCSSQTLVNTRNDKLNSLGAVPLYRSDVDDSFNGFFRFGCSDSLRVVPTIKGVNPFELKYWAVLILIILLVWGITRFGVHS